MSILQPTYYTRHPDETYSVADPQPNIQPVKQEPVTISCECGDIYERDSFGGRFIKLHGICPNCDAVPQAEQEPVAVVGFDTQSWRNLVDALTKLPDGTKLYAAPVRTKDLTDHEIAEIIGWGSVWQLINREGVARAHEMIGTARAVIAADREKNR